MRLNLGYAHWGLFLSFKWSLSIIHMQDPTEHDDACSMYCETAAIPHKLPQIFTDVLLFRAQLTKYILVNCGLQIDKRRIHGDSETWAICRGRGKGPALWTMYKGFPRIFKLIEAFYIKKQTNFLIRLVAIIIYHGVLGQPVPATPVFSFWQSDTSSIIVDMASLWMTYPLSRM